MSDPIVAAAELEVMPPDSHMGSDGRAHHKNGFSFIAVIGKCPAAERSETSAKSLAQAGERGVELHLVLQKIAEDWVESVSVGKVRELEEIALVRAKGLPVADINSVGRVVSELKPFFSPEPGMLFGTEERINLWDNRGAEPVIISFGYYDLFLKLGRVVLIVDHKFVRKEVEAAEDNRQGHAIAVSVWQEYDDVDDIIVLFTMPECESSIHRFNRLKDEIRLTNEIYEIFDKKQQPVKRIQAGDHCVYCRHRGYCEAAIGTMQTMVTAVEPLAIPAAFAPHLIKTQEEMAILRYWGDTLTPIIDAIKEESLKWAQNQQGIHADFNGQHIEYKVQSRAMPRKVGAAIEIWKEINPWMPIEAMLSACKIGVTDLTTVVVALLSDRIISEGGTPNATKLEKDFTDMLMEKQLLTREEGRTFFLKRVKASATKKKKNNALAAAEPEGDAPPAGDSGS